MLDCQVKRVVGVISHLPAVSCGFLPRLKELQRGCLPRCPAPLSHRDQPQAVTPSPSMLSGEAKPQQCVALRKPSTNTGIFARLWSLLPLWGLLSSPILLLYPAASAVLVPVLLNCCCFRGPEWVHGEGVARRLRYIWVFIEKSLGTAPTASYMMLPDTCQVHARCSHIRDVASHVLEPLSSVFRSVLLQHCLPAWLLGRLAACRRRCVCVCLCKCVYAELWGETWATFGHLGANSPWWCWWYHHLYVASST